MSNTQPASPAHGASVYVGGNLQSRAEVHKGTVSASSIVAQQAFNHEPTKIVLDSKRIPAAQLISSESKRLISSRGKNAGKV